ncbi:MAG: hypothetical protein EBR82_84080 [Caulobacteraceae bacterium]|nr:hypothetical protein [Caulobacteraceae bacterium]
MGLAENPNEYKRHISVNLHPVGGGWEPERSYWSFVQGDSREDDTVYEVQKMLPHENTTTPSGNPDAKMVCPGIIYIDTEHSYECLKRELEIWPDIGDEKTLYVFHDTVGFPHMTQAILEAVAPGGRFHETHDYKLLWHTCSGLSALVPKAGWGR